MGCHCNLNSYCLYFNNVFMDIERENSIVMRKDVNDESVNSGKWRTSAKSLFDWSRFISFSVTEMNMDCYFMEAPVN